MKWLAVIVILVLIAVSAKFRKFAAILILVGAIGGILIWQYQEYDENQSKKLILPSELSFEGVSLEPSNGSYNFFGRIINHSDKYSLSGVQLKLIIRDCEQDDKNNCIIISEVDEYIFIHIPPKQARDFKKNISLYSDINIEGILALDYTIEYAETK
jgi:hypothetical protein